MKTLLIIILLPLLLLHACFAQSVVRDQSLRYQEERMVYQQWDQNKFTPKAGFLSLNPYYWLVWGLFHPSYHKTDLRPLSATGPQTQRLALVAALNTTDNAYKQQSDTVRNTAVSQIASVSGLVSDADPLWQLYYRSQLAPVINHNAATLLLGLTPAVSQKLMAEGTLSWYTGELDMLRERLQAARSSDMDRGARILAYHRYLMEYRTVAATWATRIASAASTIRMAQQQQRLQSNAVTVSNWTPQTDIEIAKKILEHLQ